MPTPPIPPNLEALPERYHVSVEFYADIENSAPSFGDTWVSLDLPVPGSGDDPGLHQDVEDFLHAVVDRLLGEHPDREFYRIFRHYSGEGTLSTTVEDELVNTEES